MYKKSIDIIVDGIRYCVSYGKDIIDKSETQFPIIDVQTGSNKTIRNLLFIMHYYPLGIEAKITLPVFQDEFLERLKWTIARGIIENEKLSV